MTAKSLYSLARPALFALDPETAHHITLESLRRADALGIARLAGNCVSSDPRKVMGLTFPNPVGLAAGLDKDGAYIDALSHLGFGFIEVGTVTPRAQPGNPRPRMFRLPDAHALINRMGFNNGGLDALIANLRRSRFARTKHGARRSILGINIGKNADTPLARAADDYLTCLSAVYRYADYVTVNVSSPNTKNLRQLQDASELDALLAALKNEQTKLADGHGRYVPLALKIAPDLNDDQIEAIAAALLRHRIDGAIATNTTLARIGVQHLKHADKAGGLSGAPLLDSSNAVIRALKRALGDEIPIIGVGGILSGGDAQAKIAAGARLVQLYTGLIYCGPALVAECARALRPGNTHNDRAADGSI